MNKAKKKFMFDQAITNSISGAFQRARIYMAGLEDDDRKDQVRKTLGTRLETLSRAYKEDVDEETHCQNIESLAKFLTDEFKKFDILRDNSFRIGVAQKALNLHLKYLWCMDEIRMPPHCPIDRSITDKLDLNLRERKECNWTEFNKIETYKFLIRKCKEKARGMPLAEWELREFNNRINTK